jgi:hypothetical protein
LGILSDFARRVLECAFQFGTEGVRKLAQQMRAGQPRQRTGEQRSVCASGARSRRVNPRQMSDEQQGIEEHHREIAEKIRQLARQTHIPEAQEELFDLADRLDREAEVAKKE